MSAQPLRNDVAVAADDALPFLPPNWNQEFDVQAHLSRVPTTATVKGMFWNDLQKVACSVGAVLSPARYASFHDYPLVDYMHAVAEVSGKAYPTLPTLQAIRNVGVRGFATLSDSLAGRVLFAIAGRDLPATLGLVSEAYKRCLSPGTARLASLETGSAVIELRSIWNFTLGYQVGVFEGAIGYFGHSGRVQVRAFSPCDADYLLEWI